MADFDLASATPVQAPGFDLASARPVGPSYGSPQFDAARAALIKSNPGEYDPNSPEYQAKYGATSGNNFFQNARIGIGKLYTDVGLGAQQLYARGADALLPNGPTLSGLVTGQQPQSRMDALRAEAAEKAKTDAAIMHTGGGKVGSIAGALPLAMIPGAGTLTGSAITGAGLSLLNPQSEQDTIFSNPVIHAAEGAGIGALGYKGAQLVGSVVGQGIAKLSPTLARQFGLVPPTAEEVVARSAAASPRNAGAAVSPPDLSSVSPEFKNTIAQTAEKNGGQVNPEALQRHIEAQSLPVPVALTEGQATQDAATISREMNARGASPPLAQRFNEQNGQLTSNLQALRDEVGPEVFSTNAAEHGDTLIAAYKAKNQAAQDLIASKYQALRDANGGDFPVDAPKLLENATAALHKQLLFDSAPKDVMLTLNRLADKDSMTFENFESLRTNLARIQRSPTADGNAKAAAGVIRDAMEQLPLSDAAAGLKPLADDARAAARTQFRALEADPAYNASVNDTVSPDRFVSKFVTGGTRDSVATMRQNLADDSKATQTMGVATLDALRSAAKIDSAGNGNFSSPGFNAALESLSPKLGSLLPRQTTEQLQNLGNVARYTQFQPRGSYVNNSNTLTAAGDFGAHVAEHAVNSAAHGLPLGTAGRILLGGFSKAREARAALAPGAGLNRMDLLRSAINAGGTP